MFRIYSDGNKKTDFPFKILRAESITTPPAFKVFNPQVSYFFSVNPFRNARFIAPGLSDFFSAVGGKIHRHRSGAAVARDNVSEFVHYYF